MIKLLKFKQKLPDPTFTFNILSIYALNFILSGGKMSISLHKCGRDCVSFQFTTHSRNKQYGWIVLPVLDMILIYQSGGCMYLKVSTVLVSAISEICSTKCLRKFWMWNDGKRKCNDSNVVFNMRNVIV